jgi:hypothetical protein
MKRFFLCWFFIVTVVWSLCYGAPADRVVGNMMLINDNGGWCWYQDDKIVYDPVGGNILTSTAAHGYGFGGVGSTRDNDMDATTFNIATGKRTRVVAREGGGGDDHNMGAFWIRPDGRYLHMYCMHYNNQVTFYRVSTNPYDGSSWDSEQSYNWLTIPGSPGSDTQTSSYTNVHFVSGEGTGSGRLYNIIRIFNRTPCISYSDDSGAKWNYMGRLNDQTVSGYSNFYHKFRSNGVDRIDFIGTEAHPRDYDDNSIYHGYIQGGKSYDSNGVEIDTINDQDAPTVQAFTPVWLSGPVSAGSYHTGWTNELELDDQGYPVCLFQTRYGTDSYGGEAGAADHRFFYGRFDGSAWNLTELAKMGEGLHSPEQDYLGMGCIHPDDANVIYISTPFDPRDNTPLAYHEIFKGVTSDFGASWDWTQITIDSTEDNIRPAIPQWDKYNTAVFWTRGVYPGQEQYDFVLVGMVQEQDVTLGLVNYIDATESNTEESDGSDFTPTGPSGSAGAADNQWHEYTGYGNGGSCYTAGDGGTENAPTIRTTVTGLSAGTYDVFAYFWCDPDLNWGVRGGFSSSDMLCFSKQSSQHAEASQFSGSVDVDSGDYILYRVYIGRKGVSGGGSVTVYIDNYDSSYSGDVPSRTTYDGIGVASISYEEDVTPPEPNVMTWASLPSPAGPTSITMTATTATDDRPPVQYYFECITDGDANSTWQTSTTYVAQGLNPSTSYSFRVKARDNSSNQNETDWSTTESATTDPPDTTPPSPDPMDWAAGGEPSATGPSSIIMTAETATDAVSPPVEYYFECTTDGSASSTWQSSPIYEATGLDPLTLYTFRVKARDSYLTPNETGWSGTASATTEPPSTDVEILGDWATGDSHTKESGTNRALIFFAHGEETSSGPMNLTAVTYGGQSMTKVVDRNYTSGIDAYVAAFILDDANVAAATGGTFVPTWSINPDEIKYASVFLQNVNQDDMTGDSDTAGGTSPTISTSSLTTSDGDMVIAAATCGNTGTYTFNNGFTRGTNISSASSTGASGYKSATGSNETPSVTHSNVNRQALIGFVVQVSPSTVDYPPAAPTGLVATAGNETVSLDWNDNSEGDLAGYNVYRSTIQGNDYTQINGSLVVDSNYVDNDVNNFDYYYYVVTAVDANDHESGFSNEASAVPAYQTCADVQAAEAGLVSDLTGNCYVNPEDLEVLVSYWLNTNCGASGNCSGADFEPDGDVDFVDYSDFAVDWMECDNPEDANCPQSWWPTE